MLLHELLGKSLVNYAGPDHPWSELMGVELELEDVSLAGTSEARLDLFQRHWTAHDDRSLRHGVEYVTARPVGGEALDIAVRAFYACEAHYTHGPRTSTHIHVNMLDSDVSVLQSMFILMYAVEDALFSVVEETRKWAGYCMPLSEMHEGRIRKILNPRNMRAVAGAISPGRNQERYYGFNTNMARHGTVEFRYFPGGPSETELRSWIDFVVAVKKFGKKWMPDQLIEAVTSPDSLARLLLQELGQWGSRLLAAGNLDQMYQKFVEVAAMYDEGNQPELGTNLVYVNEAYLSFIVRKFFDGQPEAADCLTSMMGNQRVFSKNDWEHYLGRTFDLRTQGFRYVIPEANQNMLYRSGNRPTRAQLEPAVRQVSPSFDPFSSESALEDEEPNEWAPTLTVSEDDEEF